MEESFHLVELGWGTNTGKSQIGGPGDIVLASLLPPCLLRMLRGAC